MRPELEILKEIESYINNKLSENEKKAFEDKLKLDADLAKEVELQRSIMEGVERIGVKKSIIKAGIRYRGIKMMKLILLILILASVSFVVIFTFSNHSIKETDIQILENEGQINDLRSGVIKIDSQEIKPLLQEIKTHEGVLLPEKNSQFFIIDSSIDTTIVGKEGTKISFRANSLDIPKKAMVEIELKEYYKMSDIVFSNLTTETINNELLETGGMVYIAAKLNNKSIELKNDRNIEIRFPFENKKEEMKLFFGQEENKTIKWVESSNKNEIIKPEQQNSVEEFETIDVFSVVETMPNFIGGQEKLFTYLAKNLKYPAVAKDNNISGTVFVNFIVDSEGLIKNAKILRGIHPLLDNEALRVINTMPRWSPGVQKGKNVSVSYNLPIKFSLGGSIPMSGYTPEQVKKFNDSIEAERKNEIERNLFDENNQALKIKTENNRLANYDISNYVFSSSNLGWINCDRFVNKSLITQKIKVNEDNVQVKLIFHSIKSIMSGYSSNSYSSHRVPQRERVTVFAIKYINKIPYVCLQEFITSANILELNFEELTKEKLKQYTEVINQI